MDISEITKEFRLKKYKLCQDLLNYLRLDEIEKNSFTNILVTLPSNFDFEILILKTALKYLEKVFASKND